MVPPHNRLTSNSRFLRYLLQLQVSLYHMATSNPVANNTLVDQYWLHAKLLWSSYRTAHILLATVRAESCLSQASHYRVLKVHDTFSSSNLQNGVHALCLWQCRDDNRHKDRPHMKAVLFIGVPKRNVDPEKWRKWVNAFHRGMNRKGEMGWGVGGFIESIHIPVSVLTESLYIPISQIQ